MLIPMANLEEKRQMNPEVGILGIGNETGVWRKYAGEYYADMYKHYQSFCKNYSETTYQNSRIKFRRL